MDILNKKPARLRCAGVVFFGVGLFLTATAVTQAQELQLPREPEGSLPSMRMYQLPPAPIKIHGSESSGSRALSARVPVVLNKENAKPSRSLRAARSLSVSAPLSEICKEQTNKLSAEDKQRQGLLFGERCPFLEKAE